MSPTTERTVRAAYITKTGGPERIRFGTLPEPVAGPGQALVAFLASEVNHVDGFVRSGAYETPMPMPFVIGRDLVGTVSSSHGGHFAPGDRVWCSSLGHGGRQGSFADVVAVDEDRLYRLPDSVDPEACAAVIHGASTAQLGLFQRARIARGDTVFIGGAAGAVGSAAVQLASAAGARVIASASPRDHGWCRSLGAEAVFDYRDPQLAQRVSNAAPAGVQVWWDTSGNAPVAVALRCLAPGGAVLITAGLDRPFELVAGSLYTRDLRMLGFAISNASVEELARAAACINEQLTGGRLTGRIARRYPLSQAAEAHQALEEGGLDGRIIVTADSVPDTRVHAV